MNDDQRKELFDYADHLMNEFRKWPACPITLGQFGEMLSSKEREIIGRDK